MVQGKKKKAETWLANSKTMYLMKQDQRFKWMNDNLEIKNMYNNNFHGKKLSYLTNTLQLANLQNMSWLKIKYKEKTVLQWNWNQPNTLTLTKTELCNPIF